MDSPLLLSRDGYLLEPIVWPKGIQASCGDWREDSGLLYRPCRKKGPHLAMTGHLVGFLQLRRQYQISHEVQQGAQRASRALWEGDGNFA